MKKVLLLVLLMLALGGVACGGGGGTPAEAPVEQEPAAEESAPAAEPTAAPAEAEEADEPAAEEAAAEDEAPAEGAGESGDAPASDGPMVAGRPATGIDPDTNLEINPPAVVPGVDFIVRGEIVNANLTPQESPEFVILSPDGTRFRIRSQAVADIAYEDGTVPALHEFQRGVLVQATVRQEEGAGATITVQSTDFTLLHPTE